MSHNISIIEILLEEHGLLRKQFSTLLKNNMHTYEQINEFLNLLKFHLDYEEKLLYTKIENTKLKAQVLDFIIEGFEQTYKNTGISKIKLKILSEILEHLLKEEEEDMFPTLYKILNPEELYNIGQQFLEVKMKWQQGNLNINRVLRK